MPSLRTTATRADADATLPSSLTVAGRWMTLLAVLVTVATNQVKDSRGPSAMMIDAVVNVLAVVLFAAGPSCWIIGARRDRKARKTRQQKSPIDTPSSKPS